MSKTRTYSRKKKRIVASRFPLAAQVCPTLGALADAYSPRQSLTTAAARFFPKVLTPLQLHLSAWRSVAGASGEIPPFIAAECRRQPLPSRPRTAGVAHMTGDERVTPPPVMRSPGCGPRVRVSSMVHLFRKVVPRVSVPHIYLHIYPLIFT